MNPLYFNENDSFAARWLGKLWPDATVDARSVVDVAEDDVRHRHRVHLFGGIGGWEYALELAGWPTDRPVWTGSCPCTPFSCAGKKEGTKDKRHLWPEMFRLIRECHPPTIFGEQVETAVLHGWLDGVFGDLEEEGYACGAVVLGAHSVGAPHRRQRLYWVAQSCRGGRPLAMQHPAVGYQTSRIRKAAQPGSGLAPCGMGLAGQQGLEGLSGNGSGGHQPGRVQANASGPVAPAGSSLDAWSDYRLIPCVDGKSRRIESSLQPLAHGVPARVGRLRGYGNAIVPQTAAAFVRSFMETGS